jgi:hypothetical protein
MKLIALSTNKNFIEFLDSQQSTFSKEFSLELVKEVTSSKALAQKDKLGSLFLIDLDLKKEANALKEGIKNLENCKWIGVSEALGPKDFRKLQMEDFAPDALIKIPSETDDFLDTLKNILQTADNLNDGATNPSQSGLNFVGLSDSLNLEDQSQEEDLSLKEINLNEDVKLTLNEHTDTGDIEESLNSKTNVRIQNKFDLAFSDGDSLNLESDQLNLSEDIDSLSLNEDTDSSGQQEIDAISLNLGDGTSTSLSSPKMLPGLKISSVDTSAEEVDKTVKVEDDIGRLDITSTGIKFKKSDLMSTKSKADTDSKPSNFKFDQHKVESIIDDDGGDLNLNFTNVPDEVPFDAKAISLTSEQSEGLKIAKNETSNDGELDLGGDLSLDEFAPSLKEVENDQDDATVLTQNLEMPEFKIDSDDEPPSLDLTSLSNDLDENGTMATIIDPVSSKKSARSGLSEETDFNINNTFNEFKSGLDQTHQDLDLGREHFTIDTDLLDKHKKDEGFTLDEEAPALPASTTKSDKIRPNSFQHENLEEQVRDRNLYMDDLGRLKATIHDLREERESFTGKISKLEGENESLKTGNVTLKAELEELKAEIKLIHTRNNMRVEDLRKEIDLLHDKKILIEEKNKALKNEISKLEQKFKIDLNQVRQREKELEGQLDLVKMDTESQVYTRDTKILDLKKKIDALEFNMENMAIKEQKVLEDKIKLEERLNKIMSTLRGSIKVLEEDVDLDQDV